MTEAQKVYSLSSDQYKAAGYLPLLRQCEVPFLLHFLDTRLWVRPLDKIDDRIHLEAWVQQAPTISG